MPKLAIPLTELQIRKAPAKATAYSLADGNGLSLLVSPAGLKTWTVRYRLAYADGDRLNLCRDNLLVRRGTAWTPLEALQPKKRTRTTPVDHAKSAPQMFTTNFLEGIEKSARG